MNSFSVFVLIVFAFLATASALPSLSSGQVHGQHFLKKFDVSGAESTLDDLILEENSGETGDRFPRVTCDILSVTTKWGSLQHAACATRCLAMRKGYKGGHCKDGACHCRK